MTKRYFSATDGDVTVFRASATRVYQSALKLRHGISFSATPAHLMLGAMPAKEITKAQEIILELASSVDPAKAPELSERLLALYDYMQARLSEANMEQKDEPLAIVDGLLRTLRKPGLR